MRSFRDRNPIRIGIASLIVLGGLLFGAFSFKKLPFIANDYTLLAEFADAAGLAPGNEVRVAGLKVGSVSGVDLAGDRVIVTLKIDDGIEIPAESTAEISLKTILGTKFVVINARAEGEPLDDGGRIPLARTSIPFEIYQVTNAAVDLLTDVDGGQLNEAFQALADITADPQRNLARTLDGAATVLDTLGGKRSSLDTLVRRGEELLETLDASAPDIQRILEQGNIVLEVLARRRSVVQDLLRNTSRLAGQLGGLIAEKRPELDTILEDLHTTLLVVDASLSQLEEALRLLGPSSEAFARIAWRGRWASVCTFAAEASVLPPLPPPLDELGPTFNVGTEEPGSPNGPVDCAAGAAGSPVASGASATRVPR